MIEPLRLFPKPARPSSVGVCVECGAELLLEAGELLGRHTPTCERRRKDRRYSAGEPRRRRRGYAPARRQRAARAA